MKCVQIETPKTTPLWSTAIDDWAGGWMKTALGINQRSKAAFGWYLDYLRVLEEKDLNAYVELLGDDVELVIGNADPVIGREAVRDMLASYLQSFAAIEHDLRTVLGDDFHFVLVADNHYLTWWSVRSVWRRHPATAIRSTPRSRPLKIVMKESRLSGVPPRRWRIVVTPSGE